MSSTEYLRAKEVQRALGISGATYYRWLREGKLKGVKVGRRWRFSQETVDRLLGVTAGDLDVALQMTRERLQALETSTEDLEMIELQSATEGQHLARLVVEHALKRKASDVHIAPVADGVAIRERIDGVLTPLDPLPDGASESLMEAFKGLAGMDTAFLRAQNGQFFASHEGRKIDVRASTFPTGLGESLTLRLLDPARVTIDLDKAGYRPELVQKLRALSDATKGVVLVTGPGGNGKTTTLYCLLAERHTPDVKIMTAEDPVEFYIDGVLQANIGPDSDFQEVMKAMLRNDLDVGMVGELPDAEATRLLFEMSSAGHLMFSVLNAPDAVGAVAQLLKVGQVPSRVVCENLRGVLAQRLTRRVCKDCMEEYPLTKDDFEMVYVDYGEKFWGQTGIEYDPDMTLYRPVGCDSCSNTGYRGRMGIHELMEGTPKIKLMIKKQANTEELFAQAMKEGMSTLRQDGIMKVFKGLTDLAEVRRVCIN